MLCVSWYAGPGPRYPAFYATVALKRVHEDFFYLFYCFYTSRYQSQMTLTGSQVPVPWERLKITDHGVGELRNPERILSQPKEMHFDSPKGLL